MKAIANKKPSIYSPHLSKPFFKKSDKDSLLSSTNKSNTPFFNSITIQPKLTIGQSGDKYEQEADAMAEKVVQRKCIDCQQGERLQKTEEDEMTISKKSIFENDGSLNSNIIQGKGVNVVAPDIEAQLQYSKGAGHSLDKKTRQDMEQSIGSDFTNVKVHTGNSAIQMNQILGAQAFTNGNNVYFNKGKYDPTTRAGTKLLAHELTHVVQQNGAKLTSSNADWNSVKAPNTAMIQKQNFSPDVSAMTDAQIRAEITRIEAELASQVETSETTNELESTLGLLREEEAERSVLSPRLNEITTSYMDMIRSARSRGYHVAADNLQHFLTGSGAKRTISVAWLRGFSEITSAEEVNRSRFEESLHNLAISMPSGTSRNLNDYWDRSLTGGITTELYYASGTSTITSTGEFVLTKNGDNVTISGTVSHHWWDPYDWHANLSALIPGHGVISDADALLLQRYRQASPFPMESDWTQTLSGTIEVINWFPDNVNLVWTGP